MILICRGAGFSTVGGGGDDLRISIAHGPGAHGFECLAEAPPAPSLILRGGGYTLEQALVAYPHRSGVRQLEVGESLIGVVPHDYVPALRELLIWENEQAVAGLADAPDTLDALEIKGYRGQDLAVLRHLRSLHKLTITAGQRLISLRGLEGCIGLRHFHCVATKTLQDVGHLPTRLENLALTTCRGIESLDFLAATPGLAALALDDCGPLPTLDPARRLEALAELRLMGDTNIQDGRVRDLAQRLGTRFACSPKRHYDWSDPHRR